MGEVVKEIMVESTEEAWSWEARDILLDTWTTLLLVCVVDHIYYSFPISNLLCYLSHMRKYVFALPFNNVLGSGNVVLSL